MILLKTLLLILISPLAFSGPFCSDVLSKKSSISDESGFINFLNLPPDALKEQEEPTLLAASPHKKRREGLPKIAAPRGVKAYFKENAAHGLKDLNKWKQDFLEHDPRALNALEFITKTGAKFFRREFLPQRYLEFFNYLNHFTYEEIKSIPVSNKIELLKAFTRWGLLPTNKFRNDILKDLAREFNSWSERDYFNFSVVRRLSPMNLPPKFLEAFKAQILIIFNNLSPEFKLSVLTAEIFHETSFSENELHLLLTQTFLGLKDFKSFSKGSAASLKNFYRALLFLSVKEKRFFNSQIQKLDFESLIEEILNKLDSSLFKSNNLADDDESETTEHKDVTMIKKLIADNFNNPEVIPEYSQIRTPGFFDPVDFFYPDIKLVFEQDGMHHYFRRLNKYGQIVTDYSALVLRPIDKIKDISLRLQGYKVFRYNRRRAEFITPSNFKEIIKNS